ncbi:YTH domain-containing protein 1 [Trichoplax sp. H2]|nr:YTH domain-containing protein 1 [Trichoplax sp. H2]|eukprot:RDD42242.1 YTH domain-containing protein 1 [Trichoplax sp. H2]
MTSRPHNLDDVAKSNSHDDDGKPGEINVLEDILGGDDEVADEFDNELYKIETSSSKDTVERNLKHTSGSKRMEKPGREQQKVISSSKTTRLSSYSGDDRPLKRRAKTDSVQSYKYEEARYGREGNSQIKHYEGETASSYHINNRYRVGAENLQFIDSTNRSKDRKDYLDSRRDSRGLKRGESENYGRNKANLYQRSGSGSPRVMPAESERFSRNRRPEQRRYYDDEKSSKKMQSRERSSNYNYRGDNINTNVMMDDFRSNSGNRSGVKRSSNSLNMKSVHTDDNKFEKRKTTDLEGDFSYSHKFELSPSEDVLSRQSGQSVMSADTENQSKILSSVQHTGKAEQKKDSPLSTPLSLTKILSSCDALSSDDDESEEFIAVDSYRDSDVEAENVNANMEHLDQKTETKCEMIPDNDKLPVKPTAVLPNKVKTESLNVSVPSTEIETKTKPGSTIKDENMKKSSGLPFKICRSRFSNSAKDKADTTVKDRPTSSYRNRETKQQSGKLSTREEGTVRPTQIVDVHKSGQTLSLQKKSYKSPNESYPTKKDSGPYHIDDSEADERDKLLQTLFCNAEFYVVKSDNYENVALSKQEGVWSIQFKNEEKFDSAFRAGRNVVLLFSVIESKSWQGFALMTSQVLDNHNVRWTLPSKMDPKGINGILQIQWLNRSELPFSSCRFRNSYNDNRPVKASRDGQEIDPDVAKELCKMFKHDPGISLSTLYSLVKTCSDRRRRKVDLFRLGLPSVIINYFWRRARSVQRFPYRTVILSCFLGYS